MIKMTFLCADCVYPFLNGSTNVCCLSMAKCNFTATAILCYFNTFRPAIYHLAVVFKIVLKHIICLMFSVPYVDKSIQYVCAIYMYIRVYV